MQMLGWAFVWQAFSVQAGGGGNLGSDHDRMYVLLLCLQSTPLIAGLGVAAAAVVGKQVLQVYLKYAASAAGGSVTKQFYKVGNRA